MKTIRVKSPATSANVGPGYDIFALTLENPYDEFELNLNDSGKVDIVIQKNIQNIPTNPMDNSAGLAAIELLKANKLKTGLTIKINKNMSSGGGMGTTGASAAATIFGLNKMLDLKLSDNEMIDYARRGEVASGGSPHADNVAAALLGGFVLVKDYNPIDVLKLELPRIPVVLAAIIKSQRTTRGFITYEIGQDKLKAQMARCSRIIHAIHTKDLVEFGKALSVDYIHEPVRGAAIPGYWETKNRAIEMGAYGCTISGGGSSVIAFCPESKQEKIADFMESQFSSNPSFKKIIQSYTSNKGVQII
ncbi:MAG: homoserine kinase [Bacteroidales bacterium]|nr:homoserine kinase [Bacteroidales bacterium]